MVYSLGIIFMDIVMRFLRWFITMFGVLLVFSLLVVVLIVNKPDLVKPLINDVVSTQLNRQFEIKGQISLSLFPPFELSIEDIHLASADWARSDELLSIEQFNMIFDPQMFFSQQFEPPQFYAQGIKLFLEKNEQQANWQFDLPEPRSNSIHEISLPNLMAEIELKEVSFQYHDVAKQPIAGQIDKLTASLNKQTGLQLSMAGLLDDKPLTATIISQQLIIDSAVFPLSGQVDLADAVSIKLNGDLGWPLLTGDSNVQFEIEGNDLQNSVQVLLPSVTLPPAITAEPYHLQTVIKANKQQIVLTEVATSSGQFKLQGDVIVDLQQQTTLQADINTTLNQQYQDLAIKLAITTDIDKITAGKWAELRGEISLDDQDKFTFNGQTDGRSLQAMSLSFSGDDLQTLEKKLGVQILDIAAPYHVTAIVDVNEQQMVLNKLDAALGKQTVVGNVVVDLDEQIKVQGDALINLNKQFKDLTVVFKLVADTKALVDQTAMPVQATIKVKDIVQADVQGDLAWPLLADVKTKLQLTLQGKSLKKLGKLLAIPQLAKPVPYQLTAQLTVDKKQLALTKLSTKIGKLELAGQLAWQIDKKHLVASLNSQTIDDEMMTYFQAGNINKTITKKLFDPNFNADIKLTIDKLAVQNIQLSNIKSQTKIAKGKLHLTSQQQGEFFKTASLDLNLDLQSKTYPYQLNSTINSLAVIPVLALFELHDDRLISADIKQLDVSVTGEVKDHKNQLLPTSTITVKDSQIVIKQLQGKPLPVLIKSAKITVDNNKEKPLKLLLEAHVADVDIDAKVATNETVLSFLTTGEKLPAAIELRANKHHFNADGYLRYDDKNKLFNYQMQLALTSPSTKQLAALVKQDFNVDKPLKVITSFSGSENNIQLSDIDLLMGQSQLKGDFLAKKAKNNKWQIATKLCSNKFELTDFLERINKEVDTEVDKDGLLFSTTEFDSHFLNDFNLDLDWALSHVTNKGKAYGDQNGQLKLKDGILNMTSSLSGGVNHNQSNYALQLKSIDAGLDVALMIDIERFNYGQMLALTDTMQGVEGSFDAVLNFRGQGNSVSQLVNHGQGEFNLSAGQGRVPVKLLSLWGGGFIANLLLPIKVSKEEDEDNIYCAAVNFVLKDGIIESQGIVIDTPYTTIGSQVQIKLPEETLKGVVQPKSKTTTIVAIETPVTLAGTLLKPSYKVTSGSVLLTPFRMFVGFYTTPIDLLKNMEKIGTNNHCEAAIEQALIDHQNKQNKPQGPVKKLWDFLIGK